MQNQSNIQRHQSNQSNPVQNIYATDNNIVGVIPDYEYLNSLIKKINISDAEFNQIVKYNKS
ncbi:MAG: hypothetical protein ACOCUI_03265, partial [bacterium]